MKIVLCLKLDDNDDNIIYDENKIISIIIIYIGLSQSLGDNSMYIIITEDLFIILLKFNWLELNWGKNIHFALANKQEKKVVSIKILLTSRHIVTEFIFY